MTQQFDIRTAGLVELMDDYRESYVDAMNCFTATLYGKDRKNYAERFRVNMMIMNKVTTEIARRLTDLTHGQMWIVPSKTEAPK